MKVPKMKDFFMEEDKIIFIFDEIIKPKDGITDVDLKRQAMKIIRDSCKGYLDASSDLEAINKLSKS